MADHVYKVIELVGTSAKGERVILTEAPQLLKTGETYQFPPKGQPPVKSGGGLGKEIITLFASEEEFPAGELLRGKDVTDRVVHGFYNYQRKEGRLKLTQDAAKLVKQSIEIETK